MTPPDPSALTTGGALVPDLFPQTGGVLYALLLLLLALALMFAGRSTIKALAFLVVGLALALLGIAVGAVVFGLLGSVVGGIIGFVAGGLIGLLLVHLGIAIGLGYFGYLIALYLTHASVLAIVVGIILFVIGVAVASRLLEAATAVLGGIILYQVLVFFGAGQEIAFLISVVLASVGFYVQHQSSKKHSAGGRQ